MEPSAGQEKVVVKGGALKLKGGLKLTRKKRRKRKIAEITEPKEEEAYIPSDPRTEAEKKFEEIQKERLAEKAKKLAQTSHREKIDALNQYLQSLPVHNDIPKVASAGLG